MHKAFISVAGEDIELATSVSSQFAADLIYLYTESGRDGADMWLEEADALCESSVLVIFWSKNYLRKRGTLREIRLAAELLGHRKLGHPLIVRLDDTPLDAVGVLEGDPSNGIQLLGPLIERWRALPLPFDKEATARQLEYLLIEDGTVAPPEHLRQDMLQRFSLAGGISPRQVRPIFWVQGHEGYGRRFLIEKYMRQFDPNSRRIEIPLVDSDGPLAALLRLRGRWGGASQSELEALVEASHDSYGGAPEIDTAAAVIEEIASNGGHVVFTFEALNADASRWIPEWILALFRVVAVGRKPKVFVVSQFSFPQGLLRSSGLGATLAPVSVNSLEFEESKDYGYRLTGFFDPNPERWSGPDIERLGDDAEGNILLLIAIARMRSAAVDLQITTAQASEVSASFTTKLNRYLNACVDNLRLVADAFALLRTLSDLHLVSLPDLKTMYPSANTPALIGHLVEMGLVETPGAGLFRVPRLVIRRLESRLDLRNSPTSDSLSQQDRYRRLLDRPIAGEREPAIVSIEARVRSQLAVDPSADNTPFSKFISASYLLQAGVQAYDRQSHSTALKLFRSCVRLQSEIPELNTRCVMLRYYGLSAAREGASLDLQKAVELLRSEGGKSNAGNRRVNPEADAEFVLGFACRLDERWSDAVRHYRRALTRLEQDGSLRIGDCHRELAECHLHERPANFADARFHAKASYASRDNIMSLDILVKTLIQSCWLDIQLPEGERNALSAELDSYMSELEVVSNRLGRAMWQQRMAEDLLYTHEPEGLASALQYAQEAVEISSRQDFHPLVWRILLKMETTASLSDLIERCSSAIDNSRFNDRTRSVAARYAIAGHIKLGNLGLAQSLFDRHKSRFPHAVISQVQSSIDKRDLGDSLWVG